MLMQVVAADAATEERKAAVAMDVRTERVATVRGRFAEEQRRCCDACWTQVCLLPEAAMRKIDADRAKWKLNPVSVTEAWLLWRLTILMSRTPPDFV